MEKEGRGPFKGKIKRFATSLVLPVDKRRTGGCQNCGACCRFLIRCPFLRAADGGREPYKCIVYPIRPLQCRKYPRTRDEQIHQPCGYKFDDSPSLNAQNPG